MKSYARVAVVLLPMLVVSMVGFSDHGTQTDQAAPTMVEVMASPFGPAPLAAQNGEGSCRSCEEHFDADSALYKHRFQFGGTCGENGPDAAGPGVGCRVCTGEDVAQCDVGHDCCHRGWTPLSANQGCFDHDTCSSGGGPDPDFSSMEVAHLIDLMVIQVASENGAGQLEMAAEVLARLVATEPNVTLATATGQIHLFGCGDDSLPSQVWMLPSGIRDPLVEHHRLALREG